MERILKAMGLDFPSVKLAYALGRSHGRRLVKGALIGPGLRRVDLERRALANGESAEQLLIKRDKMFDALLDFAEEWLNLDQD
jgi:hypothetical protein